MVHSSPTVLATRPANAHLAGMKRSRLPLAAALVVAVAVAGLVATAHSSQDNPQPLAAPNLSACTTSISSSASGRPITGA